MVRARDVGVALVAFALTLGLLAGGGVGPGEEAQRDVDALGLALAALSTLPLVFWRLAPLGVYSFVVLANAAMNSLDYPDGPPFGAAIALFLLASSRPATRVTAAVVVSLFAFHFTVFGVSQGEFPTVELLLGTSLWIGVWFVGDRVRMRRERMDELEERAQRAEREAERERRLAAAEERTRIARDLHDSAGHAINVILVHAGAARLLQERDPEAAREALSTIEDVARETLDEIDKLVRVLREGRADDEVEPPLGLAGLQALVERQRSAGLPVELDVRGERRALSPGVDQSAYRILQEALTNAVRHGAGAARVEVAFQADALELVVTNPAEDGAGEGDRGLGLVGMHERAALVGGSLEAGALNGRFRVRAVLPYAGDRT